MGNWIKLTASDKHEFDGYLATPAGKPRGGIVVVQEIFGVNHHMRAVTDRSMRTMATTTENVTWQTVWRPAAGRRFPSSTTASS